MSPTRIPEATVARLPVYLRALNSLLEAETHTCSSEELASAAGVNRVNRVGVGVGYQDGERALSVGYQRALGQRSTLTIGGAFTGSRSTVGAGVGFGW